MKILVTGVYGFIGSYFTKMILDETSHSVVGLGRTSSSKNRSRLDGYERHGRLDLVDADLSEADGPLSGLLHDVDWVVNFAAKTFVDHSIRDPQPFIKSNIVGTYNLLEQVRKYRPQKMIQISTDEVYGPILEGAHTEESPLNPGNPYSASKAAGDMLCLSYHNTYDLPILITRTENNYGPFQHPEKMMPKFILRALRNEKIPLYGDGQHSRCWLHVEDHCRAILHLLSKGIPGEIYNVAAESESTNLEVTYKILDQLGADRSLIEFIDDSEIRPGHDRRYAIDSSKVRKSGWEQKFNLEAGLNSTLKWYLEHKDWLGV